MFRTGSSLKGEAILVGGTSLNIFDQDVKKVDFSCQFCGAGNESTVWKKKVTKNSEDYITVKCRRCHKTNRYIGSNLYVENNTLYTFPTPRTIKGNKKLQEYSNKIWWVQYTRNREYDREKNPVSQDEIMAFCKIIRGSRANLVVAREFLYNMALSNIDKVSKIIESELLKEEDRENVKSLYTQLILIEQIIQLIWDRDLIESERNTIVTTLMFKIMIFSNHEHPKITRIIAKILGNYFNSDFDAINEKLSHKIQEILIKYLTSKDWNTKVITISNLDIQKLNKLFLSEYIEVIPELLIDKNNSVRWEISRQIFQKYEYLKSFDEFSITDVKSYIEKNSQSYDIFLKSISLQVLEKINI